MSAVAARATPRDLLTLAWPVILSRSTQTVVGLADALMSAGLGSDALAAVTTGAINLFSIGILPMGTVFIVQSFAAQLQGRGDLPAARRYGYYGLLLAAISTVLAIAATPFVGVAVNLFHFPPAMASEMTGYLQWRTWSIGAFVGMEALSNWFGGLGDTKVGLRASVVTMVANVALNWVLIFGHLGAPAMGVRGAALASGLATVAGLALLLVAFVQRQREFGVGAKLALKRAEFMRMLRFGIPNGLNWFMEISAFTLFLNTVVSKLGTPVLAALNAILQLNSIAFMPAFGLASAGAVLVGQAIGRGDRDDVSRLLRMTLLRGASWMMAIGVVYLLVPHAVIRMFASGPDGAELMRIGAPMLMLSAGWQLFDAFGITVGEALRAAGDTAWCMWARLVAGWVVFVPLAWYMVSVRGGGALTAIGCIIVYIALLAGVLSWRFRSGAWRRIDLVEAEPIV